MEIAPAIDLTADQRRTILALLNRHLPNTTVWAYGSRVKWTSHPASDLDLVAFAKPEQSPRIAELREAFDESNLPFRVDLFVWDEMPESFKDRIKAEHADLTPKGTKVRITANESKHENDWTTIQLGTACKKIGSGMTPRGGSAVYRDKGPCALIRSQNIHNDGFHHDGLVFIDEQRATDLNNVEVRLHDVLLNITGDSVARCCQVGPDVLPARVNQHVAIVRPDPEVLQPQFLRYALIEPRMQGRLLSWAGAGGTRSALTKEMIESFEVFAPTKVQEQRAIAEVLSDVDGLIQSLDALIAKKRAIKQATMQQLLTGKTRLPGFSGAWETKRLGEIGEISGAGVDKKIRPNEIMIRLVNYLDVYRKTFLYSKDLVQEVSAKQDQVRRCSVNKGDIFFTPTSEVRDDIGRSAVAMENISDGVYSYHVVRLRLNTNWDLRFRAYAFDTKDFYDQASLSCEGSGTRYVITLPRFRAITIRFPPTTEEQSAIAVILSDMDAEIAALERRRDKTSAIKQGMMQQLLTGRIRLVKSE